MKKREVIINNELVLTTINHEGESQRDKEWIMRQFINDVETAMLIGSSKGNNNNKIYEIKIKENNFFFIFDTTDSGGTEKRRKVSIPFSWKTLKDHIKNKTSIFIVDIYRPLDNKYKPEENKHVWLIIDPKEIYLSKVALKETKNDSSRWIETSIILDVLKGKEIIENKKCNVVAVNKNHISNFINDKKLVSKYYLMNELKKYSEVFLTSEKNSIENLSSIRNNFRTLLLKLENNNLIFSQIKNKSLLVASHIHSVEDIKNDNKLTKKEKIEQISDPFNGLLIPVGLDKLFDKYLITFNDNWEIIISNEVSINEVKELCGREIEGRWIIKKDSEKSLKYLSLHREKAFKKRSYLLNN